MSARSGDSEGRYEDLRRNVTEGGIGFAYGLAILLRRGMPSWLETLESCVETPLSRSPAVSCQQLPVGAKDNVVRVLAGMVLDLCAPKGA